MLTLYPPIEPGLVIQLQVDPVHRLHVEQSGNPDGIPVVFLHGGPGAGSNENHRRYFDPAVYRIINFDQRGCNRSGPAGETRQNTTADLLLDIERLRQHLGIDSWLVFGGSWGATLGLLYAQHYPQRVRGLVLRGVFLARRSDRDWFFTDGVNRLFPEAWDRFRGFIDPTQQQDLVVAYYQCMNAGDEALAIAAASHWADWTATVVAWMLNPSGFNPVADPVRVVNEVRIETHYAYHDYFIEENQILRHANRVPRLPTIIIHGRRDLTCTLDAAWQLHHALPGSELVIVREGGHLASEPVMIDALVTATKTMATRLIR